jgi:hypothetical protein
VWRNQATAMIALRPLVLDPFLVRVVAVIAQRLPVRAIPKQDHVTPVWAYMIDKRSDQRAAFPL